MHLRTHTPFCWLGVWVGLKWFRFVSWYIPNAGDPWKPTWRIYLFSPHCMKTGISGSLNCECCHISGFTIVRNTFGFFKLPVFYESKQHKPLSGRVSYKSWCKHLLTVFISVSLSLFFFKSNVYCWWWMYLFPLPPSPLPRINAQCVRLRWRQDRFFFLFFVLFFFFFRI